jgi:predicted peptidase
MMARLLTVLTLAFFLFGCTGPNTSMFMGIRAEDKKDARGFVTKKNARGRGYVLFVPHKYDPNKKYPLIVFLHGLGEAGDNPQSPVGVGIGQAVEKFVKQQGDFPFFVLFPQSQKGFWNDAVDHNDVFDEIALTQRDYNINPEKISLTGLSMGGYCCYAVAAVKPELFNAVAPMATATTASTFAGKLTSSNIWAFDNKFDVINGYAYNVMAIRAIKDAGGNNARHTVYDSPNHDCWTEAYVEPGFFQFLRDSSRQVHSAKGERKLNESERLKTRDELSR